MESNADHTHGPDLSVPLPPDVMERFLAGRDRPTVVLPGTERPNKGVGLYAETHVEIDFHDEDNILNCIKLLHWSDQRLSRLPDLLALWDWQTTARDGMTLHFSTGWYDKDFFEARNAAFLGRSHAAYYEMFGAKVDDLRVRHELK